MFEYYNCDIEKKSGSEVKVCLIIPYFGRLPNYFQLWLNSASYNRNFFWKFYTDDKTFFNYPSNVLVTYENFEQFKSRLQNKFSFKISLSSPYKLCDYKPAYGEVFEDELKEFEYWGFCDIDLIFGDLTKNLENILKLNYDKIFTRGHLTLFKNNFEINRLYRYNNDFYLKVFSTDKVFAFDEWGEFGINYIFKKYNKRIYDEIIFSDIYIGFYGLYPRQLMVQNNSYQNSIFLWNSGCLTRLYFDQKKLHKSEVIYVHLQKRKMNISKFYMSCDKYYIQANKFVYFNDNIELIKRFSLRKVYFPYLFSRLISLLKKIIRLLVCSSNFR